MRKQDLGEQNVEGGRRRKEGRKKDGGKKVIELEAIEDTRGSPELKKKIRPRDKKA